jgi:glyoxylase-like metal-dependent hydrolase (beta-lactamase superfamily II)
VTRLQLLFVVTGIGSLSIAIAARQPARPHPKVRAIQRVRDNLYLIPGSDRNTYPIGGYMPEASTRTQSTGGNTAVWITERGVVLVDTMNPGYGSELLSQIRSVTDKPVTTIINTHTHFDHTGSNVDFPVNVDFIAHERTKADLSQPTCAPVTNCDAFKGEKAAYLPKRTFKDRMTLFSGKDRLELYYFGLGHTNGDAWIVFPAVHAVHTGDMFQRKNMPFIDAADSGGNALAFADTLTLAAKTLHDIETVIPGHSPTPLTWSDFTEYVGYYTEFVAHAREAKKAGKSVDAAAAAYHPTDKYRLYEADTSRVKQNVDSIYASLR